MFYKSVMIKDRGIFVDEIDEMAHPLSPITKICRLQERAEGPDLATARVIREMLQKNRTD